MNLITQPLMLTKYFINIEYISKCEDLISIRTFSGDLCLFLMRAERVLIL